MSIAQFLLFPCLLSEWWAECQTAPEAPEWQLPSWWVDLYHACFQIIQNPNSSHFGDLSFSVSTIHRNLERLWFGYLSEHDSYGGCILKRKIQMFNLVFLVLQITPHYHARKSKWNHNTLIRSYLLLVSSVFAETSLTCKDWPKDDDDLVWIHNSLEEDWWIQGNAANANVGMMKYFN